MPSDWPSLMMAPKGGLDPNTRALSMLSDARCQIKYTQYDDLEQSSAFFSPSNTVLVQKMGTQLGGNSPVGFPFNISEFPDESTRKSFVPTDDGRLKVGTCTKPADAGATWRWQQVGPFRSRGGYDWWNLYYRDMFKLKAELAALSPGHELGVTAHFHSMVDSNGAILPLPPLHTHHGKCKRHSNRPRPACGHKSTSNATHPCASRSVNVPLSRSPPATLRHPRRS